MAVRGWPKTLTWSDFRPIPHAPPGEIEEAQIEPRIDAPSHAQLVRENGQVRLGSFDLTVRVNPAGSWVVQGRSRPSLLAHEQGHLDVAGLVAYENHRALEALRAGNDAQLTQLIAATRQRMQTKLDAITEKYDRETDHSRDVAQQNTWSQLIASCVRNGYRALPDP